MSAFRMFLVREYGHDVEGIAAHLQALIAGSTSCETAWELLERTGDVTYNKASFLKAAHIVLAGDGEKGFKDERVTKRGND